jgi:O-antigen/teichoic acid export membrane protein
MLSAWVQKMRSSTVARNAGWMFVGQGISIVNQGIYFVFVARLLGVSEYGLLVGAGAVVAMVSQYSSLGCGFVFLRYVGSGRGRLSEYWGSILAVTVSAGLLLSAGLHVAGRFLLPATPAGLLLSLALGDCVCSQLTLCCGQIFQTFERMRYTAMLNMATNGARAVLAACWLFGVGHATATLWAYTSLGISLATSAVAVGMVMAQFGRPMLNRRLLLSRLGEGFIFSVSGSTTSAYNDLDKAMLGHYGMNIANGIYTMAYRVVDIAYLPVRSIHAAAFPRFFRYGADGVAASARYGKIVLRRTIVFGGADRPAVHRAGLCAECVRDPMAGADSAVSLLPPERGRRHGRCWVSALSAGGAGRSRGRKLCTESLSDSALLLAGRGVCESADRWRLGRAELGRAADAASAGAGSGWAGDSD